LDEKEGLEEQESVFDFNLRKVFNGFHDANINTVHCLSFVKI